MEKKFAKNQKITSKGHKSGKEIDIWINPSSSKSQFGYGRQVSRIGDMFKADNQQERLVAASRSNDRIVYHLNQMGANLHMK